MDYLAPFGRRRKGWLLISQTALIVSLLAFAYTDPANIPLAALLAIAVSLSSASQDIAADAYRREDLKDSEMPGAFAFYMWGYRLGMVAVSGGGLILADRFGWPLVFKLTAVVMALGPITLLFSPEPQVEKKDRPQSFRESVMDPVLDFARRDYALLLFGFVLFYRLGEQLMASINTAFLMQAGYS
jgi:PAT family beta-lactamase induction signal transducer AmpG